MVYFPTRILLVKSCNSLRLDSYVLADDGVQQKTHSGANSNLRYEDIREYAKSLQDLAMATVRMLQLDRH